MIYLILDTNIWLYLANGLDPITDKHYDKLHFELLAGLKELKEQNDISILINDIVIEEWKRNKEHSKLKLKKLNNKLSNPENSFNEIIKYISSDIENLKIEYVEGLKKDILANEEHIKKVEEFLYNDCIIVPISQELKLKIFDLSVGIKAPFHNKKNNVADASILFSSAEYLKNKLWEDESSAIFVSNNIDDFADSKNKSEFHNDIKESLKGTGIKYERILPTALKLSKLIILQIEEYHKQEAWLESVSFHCRTPFCEGNDNFSPWGYLDKKIKVVYDSEESIDPNQMSLFDLPEPQKTSKMVSFGDCVICATQHLECPECGELTYIEDETDIFECTECSVKLEFKYDIKSKEMTLYVFDTDEIIIEDE